MTYSLDDLIVRLELIVCSLITPRDDFSSIWDHTIQEFKHWISNLPASISPLTRNMELLRRICVAFDNENIRSDDNIRKLIIDGVVSEGKFLNFGGKKYEVVGRTITDQGGVLFELKDEKGEVRHHEFFE